MLRSAAFVGQELHHSVVAVVDSAIEMLPEVGGNIGRCEFALKVSFFSFRTS
jgi:hypothetical protein